MTTRCDTHAHTVAYMKLWQSLLRQLQARVTLHGSIWLHRLCSHCPRQNGRPLQHSPCQHSMAALGSCACPRDRHDLEPSVCQLQATGLTDFAEGFALNLPHTLPCHLHTHLRQPAAGTAPEELKAVCRRDAMTCMLTEITAVCRRIALHSESKPNEGFEYGMGRMAFVGCSLYFCQRLQ